MSESSTTFALDSSAVVAWVLQEVTRWRTIDALLSSEMADPVLPAPGLTEVIETARRRGNTSSGAFIASALSAKGVRTEPLSDEDLVRAAELVEVSTTHSGPAHPSTGRAATLSLGDALILAVVERLDVPVVTLDAYWATFATAGHTSAHVLVP